jgi:hypothetical protein
MEEAIGEEANIQRKTSERLWKVVNLCKAIFSKVSYIPNVS